MEFIKSRLICLLILIPSYVYSTEVDLIFLNLKNFSPRLEKERWKSLKAISNRLQYSDFGVLVFCELDSDSQNKKLLDELGGDLLFISDKGGHKQHLGALFFNSKSLKNVKIYEIQANDRPIYYLEFSILNEKINLMINHWPSQKNSFEKRLLYLKRLEAIIDNTENEKSIIIGDFNTTDYEGDFLSKTLEKKGFTNIFKRERTYFFRPHSKFYSFDQAYLKNLKLMDHKVIKNDPQVILINNKEKYIPKIETFDHFGIYLKLSVDRKDVKARDSSKFSFNFLRLLLRYGF